MTTFITSDNHFSHKNIHRFCPKTRPDSDWRVMDENMIRQWNNQVQPDDTVWTLGDFFFGNAKDSKNIMRRLNGHKHLVYGNHDQVIRSDVQIQSMFESTQEYKELRINGENLVLFHYPIQEWNRMSHGAIALHGHIHDKISGVPGRILNVCVDSPEMNNGVPYALYRVEDVIRAGLKKDVRIHHEKSAP
jgi:calcineurin-like phosphoesterase family protein